MINIVTALKTEANPIIKHYNLKQTNGIFQNKYINLIITGSGKIKSAINTALLLNRYKHPTLNIGICGSSKYEINSGFYIHKITDTDTNLNYYPDYFQENSKEIFTVSKTGTYYSLVDMESSGFFEASYKFLYVHEIILYKIVSDTPEKAPEKDLIPELILNHIEVIERVLDTTRRLNYTEKLIEEKIKEAKKNMHLTKTQENLLKQYLTLYRIKNIPFPVFPKTKDKKEVKTFLTSLSEQLQI